VLASGLSMILGAGQVYFRDLQNFLPYFLRIWLYLTPILYYAKEVPERYQWVLNLNPRLPSVRVEALVMIISQLMAFTGSERNVGFLGIRWTGIDWRGWRGRGRASGGLSSRRLVPRRPTTDATYQFASVRDVRVIVQNDLLALPFVGLFRAGHLGDDLNIGLVQDHGFLDAHERNAPLQFFGCAFLGNVLLKHVLDDGQNIRPNIAARQEFGLL